jgi:conjugative relaxase-like TrwC/TraI family protein
VLTISKPLAATQAQDYYRQEYTSPSESYHSGQEHAAGRWHGKLAERWELRGEVNSEQFERLCDGRHPVTGEQLVRHLASRTYLNRYGDEVTTSEHRAGWDTTFSAPKTASLAAVVGGDERVRAAHRESVDAALDALEPYTQARMGGNRPADLTGRMVAAKFEHDAARPDRLNGYAAPQLHTHVVIFNVTETEGGLTKPVQPLETYRSQKYATAVYRINLAEKLQRLGDEVEVDARTGAPEIKGFDPEYVRESSPRSAEVRRCAKEMKARLEAGGVSVKEGAGLRQAAARADRAGKEYDRQEMVDRALALDAKYGHQARHLYQAAVERGPAIYHGAEAAERAREAVTFARNNAAGREDGVDRRKVLADAFGRKLGLTTYEAVLKEFRAREARGEFIGLMKEPGARYSTAGAALERDQARQGVGRAAQVEGMTPESARPYSNHRQKVRKLSAGEVRAEVERLYADGRVIEIHNERARLRAVAADYCGSPDGTLVISPADEQRVALNSLIRQRLRKEGKLGVGEHAAKVYLERGDMTGAERASAASYLPGEDVVRFNRASKVYGVKAGDYARVAAVDRRENTLTVLKEDGRELTYNPARLSGVEVYREAERPFSEGDRVQFRAPFKKHRIGRGALGTLSKIEGGSFGIKLDNNRSVSFGAGEFRHLDHGYAVAGFPSQGQGVNRVLINADAREAGALMNQHATYEALSTAKENTRIYTNDIGGLANAINFGADKQASLESSPQEVQSGRPGAEKGTSHGGHSVGVEGANAERELTQSLELGLSL